jgi:putative xylitol transport system substrate-binding protein
MVDKLNGKGNVVIIQGPIGQSAQIDREKGELEVLGKHPDIKIIEKKTANWDRAQALALTEDWLNAHPKGINGVIAQNDDMALSRTGPEVPWLDLQGRTRHLHRRHAGCDPGREERRSHHLPAGRPGPVPRRPGRDPACACRQDYKPQSVIWERYAKDVKWGDGTAKTYILQWVPVTNANADAVQASQRRQVVIDLKYCQMWEGLLPMAV